MSVRDALLTREELGKLLKVKPDTVSIWVKDGTIPEHTYIHVGKTYRFDGRAVIHALKNRGKGNDPDAVGSAPVQLELDFDNDEEN